MNFEYFLESEGEQDFFGPRKGEAMEAEAIQLLPLSQTSTFGQNQPLVEQKLVNGDLYDLQIEHLQNLQNGVQCIPKDFLFIEKKVQQGYSKKYDNNTSVKNKHIKGTNSPFHNYPKHLSNILKKLIIIPDLTDEDQQFKRAAHDLWKTYIENDISSKKTLHLIFNEKKRQITEKELKACGLFEVYSRYGYEIIAEAKMYLSRLAIQQINQRTIGAFIKSGKMKKTVDFKRYVMSFKKDLSRGAFRKKVKF